MAVLLHDNFTGTAGALVVGRVPDTAQHGSETWGDGSALGAEGGFALVGVTGPDPAGAQLTGSASNWSVSMPLAGVAGGRGTYLFQHYLVSGTPVIDYYIRANPGAGLTDAIAFSLNHATANVSYTILAGGSDVGHSGPVGVTLSAQAVHSVEFDVGDTAVTIKYDGITLFGGPVAIPSAPGLSKFFWRQEGGSAGQLRLISVDVAASAPAVPTAVAVTGPGTMTVGTPATYTYTLDQPAGSGGVSIAPGVTGFAATFGTSPVPIASAATAGTTTVTASSSGAGSVTGTAAGLSFTAKPVTASPSGTPPALAPGTATAGATTTTTAAATATEATGGTGPYTHQWLRSTTPGTPGPAAAGQTTLTLSDTGLTASTPYYYTMKYTDAASATANSNQVTLTTSPVTTTPPPSGNDQLQAYHRVPSLGTVYFVITASSTAWKGTAFEALDSAHWPAYAIPGSDPSGVGIYFADFPGGIAAGDYTAYAYLRAGGSPAHSDIMVGSGTGYWDGETFGTGGPGGGGGGGGAGGALPADGLDNITVDFMQDGTPINFRQAMALVLSGQAGDLSGAGTGVIQLTGPMNTVTRIVARADINGNRVVSTLTPPD